MCRWLKRIPIPPGLLVRCLLVIEHCSAVVSLTGQLLPAELGPFADVCLSNGMPTVIRLTRRTSEDWVTLINSGPQV